MATTVGCPVTDFKPDEHHTVTLVTPPKGLDLPVGRAQQALSAYARRTVIASLQSSIVKGRVVLELPGGDSIKLGNTYNGAPAARVRINTDAVWTRLLVSGDLGIAEAYMASEIDFASSTDLCTVLEIGLANKAQLDTKLAVAPQLTKLLQYLVEVGFAAVRHSMYAARRFVAAHYDLTNGLFEHFLSDDMTYSCGIFTDDQGGPNGDLVQGYDLSDYGLGDLHKSQLNKLNLILDLANVKKGDRVLEIGSGWGSLSIEASKRGAFVDTLTLSLEQKKLAEQKIAAAGFSSLVRVHLLDYRSLPAEFEKAFDAVVSIEMIEHVPAAVHQIYFNTINWALKADTGTCVIQSSTQPDSRYERYQAEDFIRQYVFPGIHMPSASLIASEMATHADLTVENVRNLAPHYARTLRTWRRAFEARFENLIAPAILEQYPAADIEVFRRKWIYYFASAEAAFKMRYATVHIVAGSRSENISLDSQASCHPSVL